MRNVIRLALALSACTVLGTLPAYAQATRTWVSGVGDDANPCSRTAPCKTFAGAISKTATGGEISVLDNGAFGTLNITKSIIINGDGNLASILASGTNGILINAPAPSVVTIRGISIIGAGTGLNGIRVLQGTQVTIDKVDIQGFTQNDIDVNPSTTAQVLITDCNLRASVNTVRVLPAGAGRVDVTINRTTMKGSTNGLLASGGFTTISNSNVTENAAGVGVLVNGGTVNVENSMLTSNGTGANAAGGTLRLSNNGIYDNQTGIGCGAGTTQTAGDNRVAGNTSAGCAPVGGAIPVM
jgi:hypothetical protein